MEAHFYSGRYISLVAYKKENIHNNTILDFIFRTHLSLFIQSHTKKITVILIANYIGGRERSGRAGDLTLAFLGRGKYSFMKSGKKSC